MHIPFTKPYWGDEEIELVIQSIKTTSGIGDGPSTKILIQKLQLLLDAPYILPVTSCTHGLELILASLQLGKPDEVIVPSFTMSSTANAVILSGALPVFADIEPDRYTIDPEDVKRCITPYTKAIILVHYAGMPCLMEELLAIAKQYHLFVIEDAAHAIGATYKGKALGTFGVAGAFSFHGTKNICCGEGGVVVTKNKKLSDVMEIYRANGTNRREFLKGMIDRYTWVGKGTSFFLSDILASILVAQVEKIPVINARRMQIARTYTQAFEDYGDVVALSAVPSYAQPNWHIYGIRFKKEVHAALFIKEMHKKEIGVSTHYVPLHDSPMGIQLRKLRISCYRETADSAYFREPSPLEVAFFSRRLPVTESAARTLVRLPIYPGLTDQELHYIIEEATKILRSFVRRL
ncbi:MAG: TDP-4-keto-6-deoxy-D-glucose transaminase [Microgenomates group bacterium GW2011_GWC1_43_11]|uniref:TDP-4-keto-6-deoxy-D-glucose transaminase n=2 Tax=Candidatus Gottesmaniibacteriota TaxID=1752720 RepID=A0A0G1KVI1_9BACT|nr:MAG: TDP-4-keto-6-deoxy-D-glucose transaminase [Microgenomates group bacterium GW2011_GWC1_43_11]KKT37788.1 MAG: TDP-4-keto-6-deoxy-D-glucose transaminase [Candidatus Gottesmanbacteria bacterium GW2011_GWB1_44_11c]KKT60342.1 MAG: TDP-4-keto-6-deoxy-D-glucose transaminase [Candidatus Gottesmanbacteria bacterium GW2011_GWA1_44_24b]HCM82333.1 dTDP-4-amino-4,6-dideoxygalactose transaminase [Patescibacteria group bacterium]